MCGDVNEGKHGYLTDEISSHYGEKIGWEFSTMFMYNEERGLILHELELISLTGNVSIGEDPVILTSYSLDGVTWSKEKSCSVGTIGNRNKKIAWLQQGYMKNLRIQKFKGTSDCFVSFARLETKVEQLNQ